MDRTETMATPISDNDQIPCRCCMRETSQDTEQRDGRLVVAVDAVGAVGAGEIGAVDAGVSCTVMLHLKELRNSVQALHIEEISYLMCVTTHKATASS